MPESPSAGLQFGFAVNTFYGGDPVELTEMMRLGSDAEAARFDSVWVGDHLLWHTPIVDAFTLLATFASSTTRVELGTAIYLLGLRQRATAAKGLTSLSALSGGRLVLGVGVGGENPEEFAAAQVDHAQRGKLLDAAMEYFLEIWRTNPDGIEPTGAPPRLLVGGRSNASRRRILRFDAGWLAAFVSPRRIAEERALLAEQAGKEVHTALHGYMLCGDDAAAVRREAGRFLSHVYAMPEEPLMRYTIAGTPEQCVEQIGAYVEAGVTELVLRPAGWDQREQLDLWAENILPATAALVIS
jgi:alkanesulfonate monooxygenase SsuD/methylene tetrahydromethanopterin reductase-like flavin-dependent oxidoreductase (luciferase family)